MMMLHLVYLLCRLISRKMWWLLLRVLGWPCRRGSTTCRLLLLLIELLIHFLCLLVKYLHLLLVVQSIQVRSVSVLSRLLLLLLLLLLRLLLSVVQCSNGLLTTVVIWVIRIVYVSIHVQKAIVASGLSNLLLLIVRLNDGHWSLLMLIGFLRFIVRHGRFAVDGLIQASHGRSLSAFAHLLFLLVTEKSVCSSGSDSCCFGIRGLLRKLLDQFLLLLQCLLLLLLLKQCADQVFRRCLFFGLLWFNKFSECLIKGAQDWSNAIRVLSEVDIFFIIHVIVVHLIVRIIAVRGVDWQLVVVVIHVLMRSAFVHHYVVTVIVIVVLAEQIIVEAIVHLLLLLLLHHHHVVVVLLTIVTRVVIVIVLLLIAVLLLLLHHVAARERRILFWFDFHRFIRFEVQCALIHRFLLAAEMSGKCIVQLILREALLIVIIRCADTTAVCRARIWSCIHWLLIRVIVAWRIIVRECVHIMSDSRETIIAWSGSTMIHVACTGDTTCELILNS